MAFSNQDAPAKRIIIRKFEDKSMSTPRARILAATNRPEPVGNEARSCEAILRGDLERKRLLAVRDAL